MALRNAVSHDQAEVLPAIEVGRGLEQRSPVFAGRQDKGV